MDKSKAKKAVKKSKSRKKSSDSAASQKAALPMQGAGITPEIQAGQISLQPADGYINPYRALGAMAPMQYAPGNMIGGYNSPVMVNPET